jgi:hypothetical protein
VHFSTSVAGTVTAIRLYVGPGNTGPHPVSLWKADGTQVGSGSSTTETTSGWQTINLTAPVTLVPGQDYVAAAYLPAGHYAIDLGGFTSAVTSGPLTVPAGGGAYGYGTGFPASTAPHNYGVDVIFMPAA